MEIRPCSFVDDNGRVSYSGGSYSGFGSLIELGEAVREETREDKVEYVFALPSDWRRRVGNERGRCIPRPLSRIEEDEFFAGICREENYCI